jgi:glucosamine--fructose-6-phosphate aminotransferase (isomerizing)
MREQIVSQPAALRALLTRRDEVEDRLSAATRGAVPGRASAVAHCWAVGHGDSYFAPLAAAGAFRRWATIPYTPMLAQEMVAYPPPDLTAGALVIVLSMSGGVGKSVAAAQTARDLGATVVAISNTPGSALTRVAHESILLDIAEPAPFLAGTVTYTASVMILLMIAAWLGEPHRMPHAPRAGDPGDGSDLAAAVRAVEAALSVETAIREWITAHMAAPVWYVLGMGPQEATARYGAAKLVEVADVVAIAHEIEEFFHEHHWVARPDHPVVILAHDAPSQQRAVAAAAHLRELEIPVALVGGAPADGALHVPLPVVASWATPLPAAVPLQWLAYSLSRARGLDPDRRSHLRGSARYVVSRKYR